MKVLIMGAGGVGGYFGGLLARAGHDITAVARGLHLTQIQQAGLSVQTVIEEDFTVPVQAVDIVPTDLRPDLILVAVKSYDLESVIELLRPVIKEESTILTLLNGVESGERLAAVFGPEHVLDGVVYIESFIREPGIIAQVGGPRRVVFGNRTSENRDRESTLLDQFKEAGWNVELVENVSGALWTKFAYLGPYAAFNTLTGLNSAQLSESEACLSLMRQMVAEYIEVGNAEGAEIAEALTEDIIGRFRNPIVGMTSMARDRLAGKKIESDALVGSVVRRGQSTGVPTPITALLDGLLQPISVEGGSLTFPEMSD